MKLLLSLWFILIAMLLSFSGFSAVSPNNPTSPSMDVSGAVTNVSPAVADVLKLARSGTDDGVLLTYISNYPSAFGLLSNNIIYLHAAGLSSANITAMIKHDRLLGETASIGGPIPPVPPASAYQSPPPTQPAQTPNYSAAGGGDYDANSPQANNYFYSYLAPYGTWSNLPGYGWGWQPTVAASSRSWTPYCDGGQWFYTDRGWYWNSYYPWGWAPFHYGRWAHNPQRGWLWFPGTTWAPSWVTWRASEDYGFIGWAPLPPGSSFDSASGMRFNKKNVEASFAFGLPTSDYLVVQAAKLGAVDLRSSCLNSSSAGNAFADDSAINNFAVAPDGSLSNWGPDYNRIARSNPRSVVRAQLHDSPSLSSAGVISSRSSDTPATVLIFRPQLLIGQPTLVSANTPPLPGNSQGAPADPAAAAPNVSDPPMAADPPPASPAASGFWPSTSASGFPSTSASGFPSSTTSGFPSSTTSGFSSSSGSGSFPGSFPGTIPTTFPVTVPIGFPPTSVSASFPGALPTPLPESLITALRSPPTATVTFPAAIFTGLPSTVSSTFPAQVPTTVPAIVPTTVPAQVPTTVLAQVPTAVPAQVPTTVLAQVPTTTPALVPTANTGTLPLSVTVPSFNNGFRFHSVCPSRILFCPRVNAQILNPSIPRQPFAPAGVGVPVKSVPVRVRPAPAHAAPAASGGRHG